MTTSVHVEEQSMEAGPATPLTALDRCDRCRAQAYVRTEHSGLELLWCVHHFRMHGELLSPHVTLDNRAAIAAPSAGH